MVRNSFPITYTMAIEASAAPIPMENVAGGSVQFLASASVTVYACNKKVPDGETFTAAYDEDGVAVTMAPAAACVMSLPSACFGYRYIKLVIGSSTATVYVNLKS